jgi:hypothetical protein
MVDPTLPGSPDGFIDISQKSKYEDMKSEKHENFEASGSRLREIFC